MIGGPREVVPPDWRGNKQRRGAPSKAPLVSLLSSVLSRLCSSGERRLAVLRQHVRVVRLNRKRFVLFLEPDKLGFQVSYSLLQAAHLGNHAGIRTADVAE